MKLPSAERAVVDIAKLRDYCLNPLHSEGKHKARVFAATLRIGAADAAWLRALLLEAARNEECRRGSRTEYGDRFIVDFLASRPGRVARLRSVWIFRTGEDFPRLVTCYVL